MTWKSYILDEFETYLCEISKKNRERIRVDFRSKICKFDIQIKY